MDKHGHNLVLIGIILLGLIIGFFVAGGPGALIGGFVFFVVGAFSTKPKKVDPPQH